MTAGQPVPNPGTKCDKCSRLMNGQWTACTCPDGPVRQPIPKHWRLRGAA